MATHTQCRSLIVLVPCLLLWRAVYATDSVHVVTPPAPATAKVAMSFAGGGFRALASDVGIFAGLMNFVGKEKKLPVADLDNTKLFKRFDTISSNSGGTWFMSELAYSGKFQRMVEGMAAFPSTAALQFNTGFSDPFKRAMHVDPSIFDPARSFAEWLVTKLLGKGDEDTIFLIQYIVATNSTWNEMIKLMLESTGALGRDQTLSSPVASWANGKYWSVGHSVLLPREDHRGYLFMNGVNASQVEYQQTVTYTTNSPGGVPFLLPAQFSMKFGEGPNYSAPFPYVAATAAPHLQSFEYMGNLSKSHSVNSSSGSVDVDFSGDALVKNAGSLPIWGVSTASSACGGMIAGAGFLINKIWADNNHAIITPLVSRAQDGLAFTTGQALEEALRKGVTKDRIDGLATGAVHGVMDGGFTEGTGLGNAVAAGAQEVMLFMNSDMSKAASFYIEILCKDGPNPDKPFVPAELYPLFANASSDVAKAFTAFDQFQLPNSTQFLKELRVGTIQLTTATNKYFGIEGGRQVTVHVISTRATLAIGFFTKYTNFGVLAQDITTTIVDEKNNALVKNTVLPMLMGHSNGRDDELLVV